MFSRKNKWKIIQQNHNRKSWREKKKKKKKYHIQMKSLLLGKKKSICSVNLRKLSMFNYSA